MSAVDYTVVHAVPGHGKSVKQEDWKAGEDPLWTGKTFPSALAKDDIADTAVLPLTTQREFYMLRFMNAITDKEDWHVKVLDETIAQKWKDEAIAEARATYIKERDRKAAQEAELAKKDDDNKDDEDDEEKDEDNESEENDEDDENDEEEEGEMDIDKELDKYPFFTVHRDESNMTVPMADYCVAELQYRAREFSQSASGAIVVFNGNVVKSDTAVSTETKSALLDAVRVLENVPSKDKDWHPGSNNQVLDLVHPSLFPVIYGKTRALPAGEKVLTLEDCIQRIGKGEVVPVPEELKEADSAGDFNPYSNKFQWLPCEVDITGEKARVISYINNLHPKHRALYSVIEDVITAAIPLWDITLAPLAEFGYRPHMRILFEGVEFDPDTREWEEEGGPEGDEDSDEFYELKEAWTERTKRIVLPEPEVAFSPEHLTSPSPFSLKQHLAPTKRPLQVIVKLANIELTPENPDYPGGAWHVEGKLNEHIVATALYYYSSSNITASSLAFCQLTDQETASELPYDQNDHGWLSAVFGCENEGPAVQIAGSVETREGRLLTFPNILQHQVQSFALEDRTKPGHRKILALFLVDPNVRVLSSATVPPQQLDWWRQDLESKQQGRAAMNPQGPSLQTLISGLPVELKDHIYNEVDGFPISLAEAKKLREELMEERKKFVVDHGAAFEATTFSLCEH